MLTINDSPNSNRPAKGLNAEAVSKYLEFVEAMLDTIKQHEHRLELLEKNVQRVTLPKFLTIKAYANLSDTRLDKKTAQIIGKRASKLCRDLSIPISKIPDETFGEVNGYPLEILEKIFDEAKLPIWIKVK